ncbi:MAG: hypothetical protein KGK09_16625 [Burkholderiales bacterium]|nr:hypothetical protein [Burkholderiales bacterium]
MLRSFDESTLWRISAFERQRAETGTSGFARLDATTMLPTTLHAELSRVQHGRGAGDPLEVIAACVRQRESALLLLRLDGYVWPLTLFPRDNLYHLPRPMFEALAANSRDLELISIEPPGLRPPAYAMPGAVADRSHFHRLPPLLWALALHVPRVALLTDIAGRAAYRASADFAIEGSTLAGALQPVVRRLRAEIASLADIARWPGMDAQRAARVLNGIYLQGGLIVLRTHRAARHGAGNQSRLLAWLRGRR